jgi:hypothetical protein
MSLVFGSCGAGMRESEREATNLDRFVP